MKLIITVLFAAVAVCSALPSTPNVHADIYMNTLLASKARIVGGQDAERRQFPYQVSLQYFGSHVCGGVLIGKTKVLTAGHCKVSNNINAFVVVVGMLNQRENHGDVQRIAVKSFIVHPDYPAGQVAPNDIAVVTLEEPVEESEAVKPIALPEDKHCDAKGHAILSGWGYKSSWNPVVPTTLQWVLMPLISHEECADRLRRILGSSAPLDTTMICIAANPGKDESACNGDSGGPLAVTSKDTVLGVVSWGITPCGFKDAPSVFTKICSHIDFINQHL